MANPNRDRIIETLWPEGLSSRVNVWMILDGARDEKIFSAVDRTYQDKCCLYSGDLPWQLQMAAPYLVQLDKEDRFTRYFIDHGWGNSWGVFFRSETTIRNLRHHLRGFLRVRDEAGRRLVFRYYDPRVLRIYLPTCNKEELRTVFGPIDQFLVEDEDPSNVTEYSFDGQRLQMKKTGVAGSVLGA
jgi:hypothetical protein